MRQSRPLLVTWSRLLALAFAAQVSCGGPPERRTIPRERPSAPPYLAAVPADTPYVFAQLEPLPREYVEHRLRETTARYEAVLAALAELGSEDDLAPYLGTAERILIAAAKELRGRLTIGGLSELGFAADARLLFYGQGVWPVLRLELASGKRAARTLSRIASHVGEVPTLEHPAASKVWHAGAALEPATFDLVVAIRADELIVAITPVGKEQASFLDQLFAPARLERSMAEIGTLQELAQRHRLSSSSIGFIDIRRAVRLIAASQWGEEATRCAKVADNLAMAMPRWVFGLQEISAKGMKGRWVIETSRRVASALRHARAPVPTLSAKEASSHAFAVGFGVELWTLSDSLKPWLLEAARQTKPCSHLTWIRRAAIQLEDLLTNLGASEARDIRGANLIVRDIDMTLGIPSRIDGLIVVATAAPLRLIGAVSALWPDLAPLNIAADGTPQPFEFRGSAMLGPFAIAAHPTFVALAAGGGVELLPKPQEESDSGLPLAVFHSRAAFWDRLLGRETSDVDTATPEERLQQALAELDRPSYESILVTVSSARNGVEVDVVLNP